MPLKLVPPWNWGATPAEIGRHYPCDDLPAEEAEAWFRAVDVRAGAATTFRWLCQLRVAPYSYDLIDNGCRRSPRALTPGVERLTVGQDVMRIFELVGFADGEHLTLRMTDPKARRLFGDILVTYQVLATAPDRSRLVAKLIVPTGRGLLNGAARPLLAWGDLIMMHRQLHTLAALAGRQDRKGGNLKESIADGE
jgi:hypothetical protein